MGAECEVKSDCVGHLDFSNNYSQTKVFSRAHVIYMYRPTIIHYPLVLVKLKQYYL